MSNEIKTGESKIEEIREKAGREAEEWFQGLLVEVRDFEKEGEAKRIIRGHLLRDYSGDIWNPVASAHTFLQSSDDVQEEFLTQIAEKREDFLERMRLRFIYRLESVSREEIAPYIPKKAGERLSQLAEYVRQNEWKEVEDIEKLIEKKGETREFVSRFF